MLPSPLLLSRSAGQCSGSGGVVSVGGLFGKQPFAVAELMAALKAPEGSGAGSLGIAEPTMALVGSVLGGEEVLWVPLSPCLCPPCGTRFLYAIPLVLSLKTKMQVVDR